MSNLNLFEMMDSKLPIIEFIDMTFIKQANDAWYATKLLKFGELNAEFEFKLELIKTDRHYTLIGQEDIKISAKFMNIYCNYILTREMLIDLMRIYGEKEMRSTMNIVYEELVRDIHFKVAKEFTNSLPKDNFKLDMLINILADELGVKSPSELRYLIQRNIQPNGEIYHDYK